LNSFFKSIHLRHQHLIWIFSLLLSIIFLFNLPFILFELLTGDKPGLSIDAVCDGSLINITEKQLWNAGFRKTTTIDESVILSKYDTLYLNQKRIPVNIKIYFRPLLHHTGFFREPVNFSIIYSKKYDSVLFTYLNTVSQNDTRKYNMKYDQNIKTGHINDDKQNRWKYFLEKNLYYLYYEHSDKNDYSQIHTSIFSGKLFLMLKYYVTTIYANLPESLQPEWFYELNNQR
jgi:hypothetical protein